MLRVEDKYIMSESSMFELEHRISNILMVDGHGEQEGYIISSLYFDDIYDNLMEDSLNGNPIRLKFRIRIYDYKLDTIKLEVKKKIYNRVDKITSLISVNEMERLIKGRTIDDYTNVNDARTLFNLAIKTKGLRPKIIVTYNRKAYLYAAGNVRITFDTNIRASKKIDLFGKNGVIYDYPSGFGTVLEVKYDEFLPLFIKQTLEHEDMIQTLNSKYLMCRQCY